MPSRTFYTPQIAFPQSSIDWADCEPVIRTTDYILSRSYLLQGYTERSAWYKFDKGPFPPPILIRSELQGNQATYSVFFNQFAGGVCPQYLCDLSCTNQVVTFTDPGQQNPISTNFCINGERPAYHFTVTFLSEGVREAQPVEFTFVFEDTLGNTKSINIKSISHIKPMMPIAAPIYDSDGRPTAYIGIGYRTHGMVDIASDISKFKIQKSFDGGTSDIHDFTSWTPIEDSSDITRPRRHSNRFTDRDVRTDSRAWYRCAFANTYNEVSQWSEWTSVNI